MYRELVEVVNKVYMWISLSIYMSERRKKGKWYKDIYICYSICYVKVCICITSSLTICHITSSAKSHHTSSAKSHHTSSAKSHNTSGAKSHKPAALSHTMIMFVTSGAACHTLQSYSYTTPAALSHTMITFVTPVALHHTLQLFTPQRRKWRESDHMALFTMWCLQCALTWICHTRPQRMMTSLIPA